MGEQGISKMGILRKVAATVIGTRIAADNGKQSGMLGLAAGMVATRIIARSPMGALIVGGGYVAHKLWKKKQQIDADGPHATAIRDGYAAPDMMGLPTPAIPAPKPRAKRTPKPPVTTP